MQPWLTFKTFFPKTLVWNGKNGRVYVQSFQNVLTNRLKTCRTLTWGHVKGSWLTNLQKSVSNMCVSVWTRVGPLGRWSLCNVLQIKSLTFTSNMFLCLIGDVMFSLVQTTPVRKGELMWKEKEITSMRKKVLRSKNVQKQTKSLANLFNN